MCVRCFKGSCDLVPGKIESTMKSFRAGFRHQGVQTLNGLGASPLGRLDLFRRPEKLWENCPIHPANSAFQGGGKKLCLSRIYRVRTTSVSICKTAKEKHLNINRNKIIRMLSYLVRTSLLFRTGSHVKAISSTSLKK